LILIPFSQMYRRLIAQILLSGYVIVNPDAESVHIELT